MEAASLCSSLYMCVGVCVQGENPPFQLQSKNQHAKMAPWIGILNPFSFPAFPPHVLALNKAALPAQGRHLVSQLPCRLPYTLPFTFTASLPRLLPKSGGLLQSPFSKLCFRSREPLSLAPPANHSTRSSRYDLEALACGTALPSICRLLTIFLCVRPS